LAKCQLVLASALTMGATPQATGEAPQATGEAPARRRQRLERDERREQILSCARKLFSERTYSAVSTSEIAREAGVARGLLHHYFGTKRELYLEVMRTLMRTPSNPVPLPAEGRGLEAVIDESVDRWLTMLERNRGTWLAAIGAEGLGRDPEVEAILEQAREHAADRLIEAVRGHSPTNTPKQLRAAMRAYSGFAEAASVQWLEHRRLTREQMHTLLVRGFLTIVRDVVPAIQGD
jgi:AcrR family transcriptional regulator